MTEPQDIDTLVKKCQSGDRDALGILYQTYLDPMREVVSYYIKNKEIVFDILHDGFLIAFASIASLKNAEKIEAWLTTIMRNLSLQYLKDESSHISVPMSDVSVDDISTTKDEVQVVLRDARGFGWEFFTSRNIPLHPQLIHYRFLVVR